MQIVGQPNFYASLQPPGDKPASAAASARKQTGAKPFPTPAQLAGQPTSPAPGPSSSASAGAETDPLEMLNQIRRFVEEDVVFHQEVVGESLLWQLDMLAGLISKGTKKA